MSGCVFSSKDERNELFGRGGGGKRKKEAFIARGGVWEEQLKGG